jgi:hypothetical protein
MGKILDISGLTVFIQAYIAAAWSLINSIQLEKAYLIASSILSIIWLVFKLLNEIKKYYREKWEKDKI